MISIFSLRTWSKIADFNLRNMYRSSIVLSGGQKFYNVPQNHPHNPLGTIYCSGLNISDPISNRYMIHASDNSSQHIRNFCGFSYLGMFSGIRNHRFLGEIVFLENFRNTLEIYIRRIRANPYGLTIGSAGLINIFVKKHFSVFGTGPFEPLTYLPDVHKVITKENIKTFIDKKLTAVFIPMPIF